MNNAFNKRLYSEIGAFLEDFKYLFEQFFYLVEVFDREEDTFYYIEIQSLFKEPKGETRRIVDFFQSNEAKGDLNDYRHHTSRIYKKFDNNSLRRTDFGITALKAYFDRNPNPTDAFVINKKKMLEYKLEEFDSKDILYATFPIIGFNKIQGSAHILFEPNGKDYEKIIDGIFFTITKLLTVTYENNFIIFNGLKEVDYKSLADEAITNLFLTELQYPKYYHSKIADKEKIVNKSINNAHEVFISYSHKDLDYLTQLESHFAPLKDKVVFWDDRKIKPGQIWRDEIENALHRATVAILLLSSDFFNSDFIANNELPTLLSAASRRGLTILTIIVRPCMIEQYPSISQYQAVNDPKYSILQLDEGSREVIWLKLARQIKEIVDK